MSFRCADSRRLTGASLLLDAPGAALEAHAPAEHRAALEAAWRHHARALADALGWTATRLAARPFGTGLTLALTAPLDGLHTAADLNERALAAAVADVQGTIPPTLGDAAETLAARYADERDPALVALAEAAAARGVAFLWDDERAGVGLGRGQRGWPVGHLPAPADVPWDAVADVPVALVTGTNGKSTTVRLLAAIARAAGRTPGVSTTDYVAVGDEVLERGDFSGPMGARAALADPRVDVGVLEVARGGLLRRGVPVPRATAAAVTNVAADHLGEYGVETVEALAAAKFVVARALGPGSTLVVSADDPAAAAEAERQAPALAARGVTLAWTSLDPANPRLATAGPGATVIDGHVAVRDGEAAAWRPLVAVAALPFALGGAARHNVRNALTAAALAAALGLPDDATARALAAFRSDDADNPGRANLFDVGGARVLLDYAHNAHGLAALGELAAGLPARRRLVLMSSAGDRSDDDLAAMAAEAARFGADRFLLADLPDYLRGRDAGHVPAFLRRALVAAGVEPATCAEVDDPASGVREALAWARPGDLLVLLVLSHRDEVLALVREAAARPPGVPA